ncbi:hypothetical protein THAOC_08609, partial [Thalassiosira oceanica]
EDSAYLSVGVIRPLPGWDQWRLEDFHPFFDESIRDDLLLERTSRWEGDVHCCHFYLNGDCWYSNWEGEGESIWEGVDNYDKGIHNTLGLLLDLDSGTLSLYQNGQKLGTLKDRLAGVYCWIASFVVSRSMAMGSASIERGYNVIDAQAN